MTCRAPWVSVLPLLGVVACADVWGFSNLTGGPDSMAPDAAFAQEAALDATAGPIDSPPDRAQEEDEPTGEVPDVREENAVGEAGEAGMTVWEGGPGDGGIDAAIQACKATCKGCCDSQGMCQQGNSTAHCGTNGNACADCSGTSCTLATGCCTSNKACGCTVALICP